MRTITTLLAVLTLAGCTPMRYRMAVEDTLDNSRKVVSGAALGGITGPMGVWAMQHHDDGTEQDEDFTVLKLGLSTVANGAILTVLAGACGPCAWWYVGASGALGIVEQTALGKK